MGKEGDGFDLEFRTAEFAKRVIRLCQFLLANQINAPMISQIIRSSSSIGANYREANDALGKKDFSHRMRISRKEAKETMYWLELIREANPKLKDRMIDIIDESEQLVKILSTIIRNYENKNK